MQVRMGIIVTFGTASMKKIEKNLDETQTNSKETVSVSSSAASAFSMWSKMEETQCFRFCREVV